MSVHIELSKLCDECGGTGKEADHRDYSCDGYCCPSCVGGWLPDDETVEAAIRRDRGIPVGDGSRWYLTKQEFRAQQARMALVAAARYQSKITS